MSDADLRAVLWDTLDDRLAGMLVIVGSRHHPQPMTHYADRDHECLWFITSAATDLCKAADQDARAHFTIVGDKGRVWAAMDGPIAVSADEAKLDELWSPFAAAWFRDGRDDPDIRLLELRLTRASVWTSTGSSFVFGYEIAKSNIMEGEVPDVGTQGVISFP